MTRIEPYGDAAVLVTLADELDDGIWHRVHALAGAVRTFRDGDDRIGRPVPGAASVLVPFDPVRLDPATAAELLTPIVARAATDEAPADEPSIVELPTRYGGPDGPDLDEVAALCGLTPETVAALHAGTVYRVAFVGFLPGFAYLAGLPSEIAVPRRATPRERVPAGSVGIAGEQTGVYPFASPGGWQLIGRTEAELWNPRRDPPALLRPGCRVRFVPDERS